MQHERIPLSYMLAVIYIGVAFMQATPQGQAFTYHTMLYPDAVKAGQIWRLATYVFLNDTTMIWLIFKALVAVFILHPLELLWGRRFLLLVFWSSTILGGLTASLLGIPLQSGGFVSLTFLLIHGLTFPQSQIHVFFLFPVKIKHLALFSCAIYLLSFSSMGIITGLAAFSGLLSGVLVWHFGRKHGWDHPRAAIRIKLPTKPSKSAKSQTALIERATEIVATVKAQHRLDDEATAWLAELDRECSSTELCAPFSFDPKQERCAKCAGFTSCLKRDTLIKIDEILHPAKEEE